MTRVVIHIDRLLLRGVARSDAGKVSGALARELQRLLQVSATSPMPPERGADELRPVRASDPESLGQAVAGRVARRVRP